MKEITWSPQAQADLSSIDDYYIKYDLAYAGRVGKATISVARYLAENRFVGPTFGSGSLRKWHIPKSPYLLIYRTAINGIEVVRIRHGHEDWKPIL